MAFTPDGEILATACGDATISFWSAEDLRTEVGADSVLTSVPDRLAVLRGHGSSVSALAFDPSGSRLVSASSDWTARVWDVRECTESGSGGCIAVLRGHLPAPHSPFLTAVAIHPSGRIVATASLDHTIRLWDVERSADDFRRIGERSTGVVIGVLAGHKAGVNCLSFAGGGSKLISGSADRTIRVWAVDEAYPLRDYSADEMPLFDVRRQRELAVLRGHEDGVTSLAVSPDEQMFVSGDYTGQLHLWFTEPGEEVPLLRGHGSSVGCIVAHPDPSTHVAASGGGDGDIILWDLRSCTAISRLRGHRQALLSLAFAPSGALLASASGDGTFRLWDCSDPRRPDHLFTHRVGGSSAAVKLVRHVIFDNSGRYLAVCSDDGSLGLWDVSAPRSPTHVTDLQQGTPVSASVFVGANARYIVSAGGGRSDRTRPPSDTNLYLWDRKTGVLLGRTSGHSHNITCLIASPNDAVILSASMDCTIREWKVTTDERLDPHGVIRHAREVTAIALDPTGTHLASGGVDRTIRIWDTDEWTELATFRGNIGSVMALALDGNGRLLASSSGWLGSDNVVRVWEPVPEDSASDFDIQQRRSLALQAEALVRPLFDRHMWLSRVIAAIESDTRLSGEPELLQAALDFARIRAGSPFCLQAIWRSGDTPSDPRDSALLALANLREAEIGGGSPSAARCREATQVHFRQMLKAASAPEFATDLTTQALMHEAMVAFSAYGEPYSLVLTTP